MTNNLAQREELTRRLSYERLRLGNTKWMCYQIHNAISWGVFLLVVAYMVIQGQLSPGFFLTYAMYFDKMRQSATEFTDRFQLMIERKSNLAPDDAAVLDGQSVARGQPEVPARLAAYSSSRCGLSLRQDKSGSRPAFS